jgi:general secretion pathway protein M
MPNLSERFSALGPREQRWLPVGAGVLLLALLIGVGVLPAVHSLRTNPQEQQQADARLHTLRRLQVRAQALQVQPQLDQAVVINKLQTSASLLGGNTEISMGDQRVNLVLRSTPAKALAEWLARARTEANAVPMDARWIREIQADEASWSGTLVVTLPPR